MDITLVGFKRFKSKVGSPLCLAVLARPYDLSDIARGCSGSEVSEVFLPDEQYNYLLPSDIGLPVVLDYDNFGGRSRLRSITVLRAVPSEPEAAASPESEVAKQFKERR